MKKSCVSLLCGGLLLLSACKNESKKEFAPTSVEFTKEATLTLYKQDTIVHKVLDIEIADDEYSRQTGLMSRDSMADNQGMLFIMDDERPQAFYMKNTRISLDIIYLDSDKRIVSFQENAKPMDKTSLPSGVPAKYVLEINGGLARTWDLQIGDSISWE
ncbi:MAG: DUF192 domain-containing protein [Gilvibacter sp.]